MFKTIYIAIAARCSFAALAFVGYGILKRT